MILQKNGNMFKNFHGDKGNYHVERKIKLMDINEWRRLVSRRCQHKGFNACVVDRNLELEGFENDTQSQETGKPFTSCSSKRFSLILRSTSRAGTFCGRLRNEVMVSRASDLEGIAQEILTSSGLGTNFQLTLKDGKGNSLTLAWTHIDPEETETRQYKRRDMKIRSDEGIVKKRQLIEEDFKQWLVHKLAKRGTS